MSLDSARDFYRRLIVDEGFREAVEGAPDGETRTALTRQGGFDFTQEELEQATVELADAKPLTEIGSEEEAETVAFALSTSLGTEGTEPVAVPQYGVPPIRDFFGGLQPIRLVEIRPNG